MCISVALTLRVQASGEMALVVSVDRALFLVRLDHGSVLCWWRMALVHLTVLAQGYVLCAGYCLQGRHLAGASSS